MALVLILLAGGGLRLYRIGEPGFTEGADFMYARTGLTLMLLGEWAWHHPRLLADPESARENLKQFFEQRGAVPQMPYSCKPLYDFLNALSIGIAGYDDRVLALGSALMGIASLGAIFLLGRRLYGERCGLCAAALLAVSGGGLVFSRYGQSHMHSLLFFILGFWCYLEALPPGSGKGRQFVLGALLFSLALATHPGLLPYIGLFVLYELALLVGGRSSWRMLAQRAGIAIGCAAGVGLALNAPFQAIGYVAGPFFAEMEEQMVWSYWPFMTYFEQLPHHFSLVFTEQAPGLAERLYTYLVVFWAWEGLPIVALMVGGLLGGLVRWQRLRLEEAILYSQILLPTLWWIGSENQAVYRFSAGTLPAALVVAAHALVRVGEALQARWSRVPAVAALCLLIAGFNAHAHRAIYRAQSAPKQLAAWLQAQGEERILVNHSFCWSYYGIAPLPIQPENLAQARYVAFNRRYLSAREKALLKVLEAQQPVHQAAHLRPGKLLEVELMQGSLVLKLLEKAPWLGSHVARMRHTVLERNALRRMELYDIEPVRHKFATAVQAGEML
jgi:4-amino-4-deoxy-L-arabinose transferase-like glycosyltransferase